MKLVRIGKHIIDCDSIVRISEDTKNMASIAGPIQGPYSVTIGTRGNGIVELKDDEAKRFMTFFGTQYSVEPIP